MRTFQVTVLIGLGLVILLLLAIAFPRQSRESPEYCWITYGPTATAPVVRCLVEQRNWAFDDALIWTLNKRADYRRSRKS